LQGTDSRSSPWAIVWAQITEWEHAAALMAMFEYRDDVLYANDSPIDELVTPHVPGARTLASCLATRLDEVDGAGTWSYLQLYSPTRGLDATREQVDELVARCRRAGVELQHRAR
jgi:hypothetical protein